MAVLRSKIGWAILNAVADGICIMQEGVYRPSALLKYGLQDLRIMDAERARSKIRASIVRLKKQKLLEEKIESSSRAFRLTKLGKRVVSTQTLPQLLPKGTYTIVTFDIPETQRGSRDAFRRHLRAMHFKRFHLSVWYSPYDWFREMRQRTEELDLQKWITVIRGTMHVRV